MSNMSSQVADVVIIGGGFAGVVAARDLSRAGFDTVLLEARDRLGGRTWYRDSPLGMPLEIGGGFVHWLQPHLWAEMNAYGIGIKPVDPVYEAYWIFDGEIKHAPLDAYRGLVGPGMARLAEGALAAFPSPHFPFPLTKQALASDKLSVTDRIAQLNLPEELVRMMLSHWTLSFSGSPGDGAWSQILRHVALAGGTWQMRQESASTYVVDGGTRRILDAIAADSTADTRLSQTVRSIRHDGDGVEVISTDGQVIRARRAIVTLPLNALNSIEFEPPLSERKSAASKRGQVSTGVKVWMRAKGRVDRFIAFAPEKYPLTMMGYEYDIGDDTILLGFGPRSADLDVSDVKAVEAAVHQWRPDIELLAVDAHDWTADPLSGETWAMLRPGQLSSDLEELLRPEGAITLAGSDYALGWSGHIDGAIESGRRAARTIIDELTPA